MLYAFFRTIIRLLLKVEITGEIPRKAPERLIVIANHQSFLDGTAIGTLLPFELTWIVHTTIGAQWHFRQILKHVPHVLVDTASPMAMKQIVQVIESGKPVCIFPEGRLTVTGGLMKVYDGLSFLVTKTNATLLPISIDGAVYSFFNRLKAPFARRWRPRTHFHFFPLTKLPEPRGRTGRERRRDASNQIRRMLEENWFAARQRKPLFESFVDVADLYGRDRPLMDDIRFQPQTYGNVLRGALALGRLVSRFTSPGERVGVMMPNASASVMLLYGMFATRRVPAMINFTSGVDGMQSACRTAGIKTVLTSRAFVAKAKLEAKVAGLRDVEIVYLEDLRPRLTLGDKLWLIAWALPNPRRVMAPVKLQDEAVVLFTSGSEGKPKGVVLSHAALTANVEQIRAIIEFGPRDKFLVALPLFHTFGLLAGALLPQLGGARVFLYPSPLHYRMIPEMAYDQDCTVLFGTSTFLDKYGRMAHPYDFHSLRYVLSGADKLAESVRSAWLERFGLRILEGYGVTECSPVVAVNTPYFHKAGTVGKFLPGVEHRLTPVEGIDRGQMLHVRGPNLMSGYLMPDQPGVVRPPRSPIGPGWHETGDVVELDDDGFVRIVGRVRRFAKVAGEMVSLEMVEQIANTASPGRGHAAVAVADTRRGEVIRLFTEDKALKREALQAVVREGGLPEIALPRTIHWLDKIPRLGNGKADYVDLRDRAEKIS